MKSKSEKEKILIRIRLHLNIQYNIICSLKRSIHFLLNFPEFSVNLKNEPSLLWHLFFTLRDHSIINLYKILGPKQDYSFAKLKSLTIGIKGITFDESEKKLFKKVNRLYQELDINTIRNKHVGHLDIDRTAMNVNWNEVEELLELCSEAHDCINLKIFKSQSIWNHKITIMEEIFNMHLRQRELKNLKIELGRNGVFYCDLDDITNILTLTREKYDVFQLKKRIKQIQRFNNKTEN